MTFADGPTSVSPAASTASRERGPLREEAVAGVDRVGADGLRRGHDGVDVEVGLDPDRVVGRPDVRGRDVEVGVDRDAAQPEGAAAAHHPERDLAAVGDQDGVEFEIIAHILKMP